MPIPWRLYTQQDVAFYEFHIIETVCTQDITHHLVHIAEDF